MKLFGLWDRSMDRSPANCLEFRVDFLILFTMFTNIPLSTSCPSYSLFIFSVIYMDGQKNGKNIDWIASMVLCLGVAQLRFTVLSTYLSPRIICIEILRQSALGFSREFNCGNVHRVFVINFVFSSCLVIRDKCRIYFLLSDKINGVIHLILHWLQTIN